MKPKLFRTNPFFLLIVFFLLTFAVHAQDTPAVASATVEIPAPFDTAIDTQSGNLRATLKSHFVRGGLTPLEIVFTYNSSLSQTDFGYGGGWQMNYNLFYELIGTDLLLYRGDGRADLFTRASGGLFVAPVGVFDVLEEYQPNQFRLRTVDEISFYFDDASHRHVTSVQHDTGTVSQFTYQENRLSQITNPFGGTVQFIYTEGRLSNLSDGAGSNHQLSYTEEGQIASLTYADGSKRQFGYTEGLLTTVTNELGAVAEFAYLGTAVSRLTSPTQNLTIAYDASGSVVVQGERRTVYRYNEGKQLVRITDALGNTTRFAWDANGKLLTYTNPQEASRTFTYTPLGALASVVYEDGSEVRLTYFDGTTRLRSYTDALPSFERRYSYEWDINHRLLRSIINPLGEIYRFDYDATGNLTRINYPTGASQSFEYNQRGDLVASIDPLGNRQRYEYSGSGNLTSEQDALGASTLRFYDSAGRMTAILSPDNQALTISYDAAGNISRVTDSSGASTVYAYDESERLIGITDAKGVSTTYAYDDFNNLSTVSRGEAILAAYSYDAINRLLSRIDASGGSTSFTYDALGRIQTRTDANENTILYDYDALGRLISKVYPDGTSLSYTYDNLGRLTEMRDLVGTTSYTYDALNRLLTVNDSNGNTLRYAYNGLGLLDIVTYPDNSRVQYRYDEAGQRTRVIATTGETTYTYTPTGLLASRTLPNGISSTYRYTPAGQLTSIQHANRAGEALLAYSYQQGTNLGQWFGVTVSGSAATPENITYQYDPNRQLLEHRSSTGEALRYTYDEDSNRISLNSNQSDTTYDYDSAERLVSAASSIEGVSPTTYTYDAIGNLIEANTADLRVSYTYDYENRLRFVSLPDATIEYRYDGLGNRIAKIVNNARTNYVNDSSSGLSQLLSLQNEGRFVNLIYGYEALGQEASSDGEQLYYLQDGLGSVTALLSQTGNVLESYRYSDFGELLWTGETASRSFLAYTGEQYDATLNLVYLRARDYDPRLGRFLQTDPLGGLMTESLSYNPYIYAFNNPINLVDPSGMLPSMAFGQGYSRLDNRQSRLGELLTVTRFASYSLAGQPLQAFTDIYPIINGARATHPDFVSQGGTHPLRAVQDSMALFDLFRQGRFDADAQALNSPVLDYASALNQMTLAGIPFTGAVHSAPAVTIPAIPTDGIEIVAEISATPSPETPLEPLQAFAYDVPYVQPVVLSGVNLRANPTTEAAIVGVMRADEPAVVIAANDGETWYQIRLESGIEGWVYAPLMRLVIPPTPTPTITPSPTETATETATATMTASATATETATATNTATFTATFTNTPTVTPSFTATFTVTPSATATITPTFTESPTDAPNITPSPIPPSATATTVPSETATELPTATATETEVPATPTAIATATDEPVLPSASATDEPALATASPTESSANLPVTEAPQTGDATATPQGLINGQPQLRRGVFLSLVSAPDNCPVLSTDIQATLFDVIYSEDGRSVTIADLISGDSITYNNVTENLYDAVVPQRNAIVTVIVMSGDSFLRIIRTSGCLYLESHTRVSNPQGSVIDEPVVPVNVAHRMQSLCLLTESFPDFRIPVPIRREDGNLRVSASRYQAQNNGTYQRQTEATTVIVEALNATEYLFSVRYSAACELSGILYDVEPSAYPPDLVRAQVPDEGTPIPTSTPAFLIRVESGVYVPSVLNVQGCTGVAGIYQTELAGQTVSWAFNAPNEDILIVSNGITGSFAFVETFFARTQAQVYVRVLNQSGTTITISLRLVSPTKFVETISTGSACTLEIEYNLQAP